MIQGRPEKRLLTNIAYDHPPPAALQEIATKQRPFIVQYIAAAAHASALDAQLIRMVTVASSPVRLNNAGRSVSATRVRATRDGRWPAFAKRSTFAYGLLVGASGQPPPVSAPPPIVHITG
jgi:hypothetical protein